MILYYQTTTPLLISMSIAHLKLFWSRKQARTDLNLCNNEDNETWTKQNLNQKQNSWKSSDSAAKFQPNASIQENLNPERSSNYQWTLTLLPSYT